MGLALCFAKTGFYKEKYRWAQEQFQEGAKLQFGPAENLAQHDLRSMKAWHTTFQVTAVKSL